MRVALVCPYSLDSPGGVATHVLGFASWLVDAGCTATVIAPGTVPRLDAGGVHVHLVGGSRNFSYNGSVAQLAVSRPQLDDAVRVASHADVVHVHEPLTPGIAHAVSRSRPGHVATHHASFQPSAVVRTLLRRRSAALRPGAVIAVSRAALASARATTDWDPVVIGNGVVLPPPPARTSGWRGGKRPRVGFLGRLDEPRKGFDVFRQLTLAARTSGLDAEFVAIGPGRVAAGPVRLMGELDDATRDRALQQLDVVVAPNLFGESFGLVLVEALAAGCAVVASDLPGFRDVLEVAGTGSLFPPGDADAALRQLRAVLAARPDPTALHGAARQWGWDELGPLVMAQYEHVLARGRAGSSPLPADPMA